MSRFLKPFFLGLVALAFPLAVAYGDDGDDASGGDAKEEKTDAYAGRFDHQVREDLFAGFQGDRKALDRGLKKCEDALAEKPDHAEAMVWRGAVRMFLSGEAFQKGDSANGMKFWASGLKDMDKAKELEPENIGVLIPRAAVLMPAGRNAPPLVGTPVLQRVREDFEATYERQKGFLDKLGEHPHGELRMGLADVYRALKQPEKSREQLEAVIQELPDSDYAKRAKKWLEAPAGKQLAHNCIGCHSE